MKIEEVRRRVDKLCRKIDELAISFGVDPPFSDKKKWKVVDVPSVADEFDEIAVQNYQSKTKSFKHRSKVSYEQALIKAHKNKEKSVYKCSYCNELGHNIRGCEIYKKDKKAGNIKKKKKKRTRDTYTCSRCGEEGHNVRTCTAEIGDNKGGEE